MESKKPQTTLHSLEELGQIKDKIIATKPETKQKEPVTDENKEPAKKVLIKNPIKKQFISTFKKLIKRKDRGDSTIDKMLSEKTPEERATLKERQEKIQESKQQEKDLKKAQKQKGGILSIRKDKKSEELAYDKLISGIFDENLTKEKLEKEATEEEIIDLLKNKKIDQTIIGGEKIPDPENPKSKEKIFALTPDLDALTAQFILNNYNKKTLGETYNEGAVTSLIGKDGSGQDLIENKNGLKIFLDVGGSWMRVETEGETKTIYLDHHGEGKREPTSGTKMLYEMMKKAEILKEIPTWLKRFINFVNEVDNLTYLQNKDRNGKNTFDENYFKKVWPNSLYAIAEKGIPFKTLISLCESGKIKDPSIPFTQEEINGELGKIKIEDKTIKELCEEKAKLARYTVDVGIENAMKYAKSSRLNLDSSSLGKIVYHNYPKIVLDPKTKKYKPNIIIDNMAFKATKATGNDTYVSWNQEKGTFFINSFHPNLSKIVEKLNTLDPECAKDIRGTMVFGKIKNLTEEEFLKTIDPKILGTQEDQMSFLKEENRKLREEVRMVEKTNSDQLFVMGIRNREEKVLELEEKIRENERRTIEWREKREQKPKTNTETKKLDPELELKS
ncbi:MAG: hypothetical protein WCO07_01110 [bacterium]